MLRLFRRDDAAPSAAQLQISHAGETYRVALKRVRGARRYILRVRAATRDVVLTMPSRGSVASARDFAERHAAWIGTRLRRLPEPVPFAPGALIPLRGVEHIILHRPQARGVIWIEPHDGGPGQPALALCVAGDAAHVGRRILDHLKREARRDLEACVRHYTGAIGKPPRAVTVRDTTSRWGSCSASGTLNFSWRLVMAPGFVLDYLAAHEVSHLLHMNHSDAFWAVVHRICPETDRAEAWLKVHGAKLHRFGAAPEQS
jgi:predicted metal-dependent hydrolase